MRLHEDPKVFSELIAATAERMGLPQVYIEKDYWITKALWHLSSSPQIDNVVFKGGTSLSKAYRLIERFSEDIDLAIFSRDLSGGKIKGILKAAETATATDLIYLKSDPRESKGSLFRKTVYQYPRLIDEGEFGQASSELLIEVNAFTHPEPFNRISLQSFIAETLSELEREDLIESYSLEGFGVNVLSIERTLVEKVLGVIKDSYGADPLAQLANRIRHLYDICLIMREENIQSFVQTEEFATLCRNCLSDEKTGIFVDNPHLQAPLAEAPLFSEFSGWRNALQATYGGVFSDLVYGELPGMDEIEEAIRALKDIFNKHGL